ncbi:MAG: hypothetical protein ACE37N_00485 [Pseudohongiellaceae bacterium]|jgi:hypothetical protein
MKKYIPFLQILGGILAAVAAVATLVNLLNIVPRPETISVVNAMIGQGVLIICLTAMSTILIRRGRQGLLDSGAGPGSQGKPPPRAGDSSEHEA